MVWSGAESQSINTGDARSTKLATAAAACLSVWRCQNSPSNKRFVWITIMTAFTCSHKRLKRTAPSLTFVIFYRMKFLEPSLLFPVSSSIGHICAPGLSEFTRELALISFISSKAYATQTLTPSAPPTTRQFPSHHYLHWRDGQI